MQTLSATNHIHPLFADLERLYAILSEKRDDSARLWEQSINVCFKPITALFERYTTFQWHLRESTTSYEPLKLNLKKSKNILLAYSGGKDSTATAIWLRDHKYNVTLYHLHGINQTYKDEWKTAQAMAEKLKLPIVIEDIHIRGAHSYIEHPMKNMVIASRMLEYGIREGLTSQIAFGNFSTSSLNSDPFEVCGGDCNEMWRTYERVVQTIIPEFEVLTPLENMKDTLDILLQHKDIAVGCQSCIGPYRYRDYLHRNNVKKYNIDLPEKRCGSCWKCCLEYIVYTDNDMYKYSRNFYKHCLDVLKRTLYQEEGVKYSIEQTWGHYFFYSKEKSKYFTESA